MFKMAWAIWKLTNDLMNSNINSVIKYVVEPKDSAITTHPHMHICIPELKVQL